MIEFVHMKREIPVKSCIPFLRGSFNESETRTNYNRVFVLPVTSTAGNSEFILEANTN